VSGQLKEIDYNYEWPVSCQVPEEMESVAFDMDPEQKFEHSWLYLNDEVVDAAIAEGGVNNKLVSGRTLLGIAILRGEGEYVERLLNAGARLNDQDNFGFSALHIAASSFHGNKKYSKYDIFRMIMRAGADPNLKTKDGLSALHLAAMNGHRAYRQQAEHDLFRIRDLVNAGIDPNIRDQSLKTPLHWAAWQGYPYLSGNVEVSEVVVNELIALGADPDLKDGNGRTALHYAAEMGYANIVYALVNNGADSGIKDKNSKTALDLANDRGYSEVAEVLIENVRPENYNALELKSVNQEGVLGEELLDAAWEGNKDRVKELLKQGADVYYIDSDGFRAIDRARDNGYTAIVEILKEAENG
jgi:cytohesin